MRLSQINVESVILKSFLSEDWMNNFNLKILVVLIQHFSYGSIDVAFGSRLLCNTQNSSDRMPEEWRTSRLVLMSGTQGTCRDAATRMESHLWAEVKGQK